jgi:uncharacterized OsmC-like protein
MVSISATYEGGLTCKAVHGPSGKTLVTEAPADNGGKGESFSPTDLTATSLLTCIMTTMAIFAERHGVDLKGMKGQAEKIMAANPRRIGEIKLVIEMPLPENHPHASSLKAAGLGCPVHHTLSAETKMPIEWRWAA